MRTVIVCFFVALATSLKAQEKVPFSQNIWIGYGVEFDLSKKIEIEIEGQQRFMLSGFEIEENFLEATLKRKVFKNSQISLGYRSTWENGEEHRINRYVGAYKFGFEKTDFEISNKTSLQIDAVSYTGETKVHLRNKTSLEYQRFKKVKPFAAYDFSFRFDNRNVIDNNRFLLGTQIRLKKKAKLNLFLRFDNEINRSEPHQELIYAAKISFSI